MPYKFVRPLTSLRLVRPVGSVPTRLVRTFVGPPGPVGADGLSTLSTTDSLVAVDEQLADSTLGDSASILLAQSETGFIGPSTIRPRKLSITVGDIGKVVGAIDDGTGFPKLAMVTGGGGGGSGDVVGPASSIDNALVRMDGTTGKLLQQSGQIIIGDDGGVTRFGPGITPNTTPSDAVYAPLLPVGTQQRLERTQSWRPNSLPNWNRWLDVSANPFGSIPNVTHNEGWNAAAAGVENAAMGACMRGFESFWKAYADAGVNAMESHLLVVQQPTNRWWNGVRRVFTSEALTVGGFGGFGVPVTVECDTDYFGLQSSCPSQAAYPGGEAKNVGSDYLACRNDVFTGTTTMTLTSLNLANQPALSLQAHKDNYGIISCTRRLYVRSEIQELYFGAGAIFEGPFTPSTTADGSAAAGSVYYSSTQTAIVHKDGGGTVKRMTNRKAEVSGRLVSGNPYYPQAAVTIPVAWTNLNLKGESGSGSVSITINGTPVAGSPFAFTTSEADTGVSFPTTTGNELKITTDATVRMCLSGNQLI